MRARIRARDGLLLLVAGLGPAALTAILLLIGHNQRDYVFLYLGLVAVLAVARGLWPALVSAVVSFLLVDYFFVPPVRTLTIADEEDIVNLIAFLATAVLIGLLASHRRRAHLAAEALAEQLNRINRELVRLNKEQAVASQAALRLAVSEEQVRALKEADRLRRDLLAMVSHELRTPLATILAESTDRAPADAALLQQRLLTIAGEARRLEVLVRDMLDMARIEGGALELHLEPIRLADAFAAAAEQLQRRSPTRPVHWDQDRAQVDVLADWERLGQILSNLLDNADRFSPPGIPIELKASEEQEGLVTVRVRDRGPGVPANLGERVFERFVRAGPDHSSSGSGLGLAIVKGLVEAHAGTVGLEQDEQGTTFRFTLPRSEDGDESNPAG